LKFELQPYHRDVPEGDLLDDLRAVASKLSAASLTQSQYDEHGRFCAATFKKRFGTWNNALRRAGLTAAKHMNVETNALLADIRRVAGILDTRKLTLQQYKKEGVYSAAVVYRLLGTWKDAVRAAGLEAGWNYAISDEELFDNMERVWRHLGRQPTMDEMNPPLSRYSHATYASRFGGYRKALEAFVTAVNAPPLATDTIDVEPLLPEDGRNAPILRHKTQRKPGWRLCFLTVRRDGHRCKSCGRSPATEPGVVLEIDHIKPWSQGGETVLENLQTLCRMCNGGKSNLPFEEDSDR
jgi:hypothetical protein